MHRVIGSVYSIIMQHTLELVELSRKSRFPLEAFVFVNEGLAYTVQHVHGKVESHKHLGQVGSAVQFITEEPTESSRHISGRELCAGLRAYAISQYGLLARAVLRSWGIHRCEDFGRIVFEMVDGGLMHKTDRDTIHDFENVFDFREAFGPASVQLTVEV